MAECYGGVLGGGTHTDVVIVDKNGVVIGKAGGGPTNPWQITFEKCIQVIHQLLSQAKVAAGLPESYQLKSLGLSLSGGEQYEAQERIKNGLSSYSPSISESYYVCTDTFGPVAAAFPLGGMVLISGTGSNCELINPDETTHRCGGWGHMLGDEGSAYWISHRAIKLIYDIEDGFRSLPQNASIDTLKESVYSFFKIKVRYDILGYLYENFSKTEIAKLCELLAKVARDTKDSLCCQLFFDAGVQLGKHVMALIPKVDPVVISQYGCVPVLLEGSVFKSWDLLQPGFVEAVKDVTSPITLYELKEDCPGALGAAVLGAKKAGHKIEVDYTKNTTVFYTIK